MSEQVGSAADPGELASTAAGDGTKSTKSPAKARASSRKPTISIPEHRAIAEAGANTTEARQNDEGRRRLNSGHGTAFVAKAIANTSVLSALIIYMGWAYLNAQLTYFNVSPLSLNISIVDYGLHSLDFFFNTNLIFFAIAVVAIVACAPKVLYFLRSRLAPVANHLPPKVRRLAASMVQREGNLAARTGLLLVVACLPLAWLGLRTGNKLNVWFSHNPIAFYLVIILIGVGPWLLTRPNGTYREGHFLYPVAVAVGVACALWVGGLYASSLGLQSAENIARNLAKRTAITLYSSQSLDLSGPGVSVKVLRGSFYHFQYLGLRLLIADSGTYYVLPVGWTHANGRTYVVNESDLVRVELSGDP